MSDIELDKVVLIAVGVSVRAEDMDRPLAYRLADEIRKRWPQESGWKPLVITDVLYLNDKQLATRPVISIGGPGVSSLSAVLFRELPSALAVDNTLIIQMDVAFEDMRCSIWGMNHDQTVEALDLFINRGYLDQFLAAARSAN